MITVLASDIILIVASISLETKKNISRYVYDDIDDSGEAIVIKVRTRVRLRSKSGPKGPKFAYLKIKFIFLLLYNNNPLIKQRS